MHRKKKNILQIGIGHIAGCMIPVIPVLVAGGLLKLVILLLGYTGIFTAFPDTKIILDAISSAPLYFLPVLVAYVAAKHFDTNAMCAVSAVAALLMPEFTELMLKEAGVSFAGIPVYRMSYSYSVFPVVVLIYLMSFLDRGLRKILHGVMKDIFYNLLLISLTALAGLIVIGPIVGRISDALLAFILYLQNESSVLAWIIYDATVPFQVITGTHWVFISFVLKQLGESGMESGFMTGYMMLSMSLTAISLVIYFKTGDKTKKGTALASFISIFFTGTSEPGLYGLCLTNKAAIIAATAAGAVAGMYQGTVTIHNYAYAFPTLFSSLTFQSPNEPGNYAKLLTASAISFCVALVIMIFGYKDKKETDNQTMDVTL